MTTEIIFARACVWQPSSTAFEAADEHCDMCALLATTTYRQPGTVRANESVSQGADIQCGNFGNRVVVKHR